MDRSISDDRRGCRRSVRHPLVPRWETLENRTVLSSSLSHNTLQGLVHASVTARQPVLGTISGQVTNDSTDKGFRHVRVELIDSNGSIVQTVFTNAQGNYSFKIKQAGTYVVREVEPKGYSQTSPTFANTAPTGALLPGYTNSSWNYKTGNNNPANGPVGPTSWNTIAPEGNQPFESPIDIQGAPMDLSQVLSVQYNNTVPTSEVNTGYQIQLKFPGNTVTTNNPDSLVLGGQTFYLTNFHYHDPAENQVNGYTYPMEEHFVNVSASGAETVLAVFLQLGAHNSALDPILNAALANLDKTAANTSTPGSNVGTLNFAGLMPSSLEGWYYQGSLTTPPLSQVVNWLVLSTPITLDYGQLQEYEKVANDDGFLPNARPDQPTDGRVLNELDFDVSFQNQSITGLNFGVGPTGSAPATSLGSSSINPTVSGATTAQVKAQSLPVLQGNTTLEAAAAAQNFQPVAGCNCPLCQMLRNAVWHQVQLPTSSPSAATSTMISAASVSASPVTTPPPL